MIVSDVSGTTRDAIHVYFNHNNRQYKFTDTAGIRRQTKQKGKIEFYSNVRSKDTILHSDILLIVIDAERGSVIKIKKSLICPWNFIKV